jgi:ubiquinol-cytochrome c reductase cytochrome b subunit
MTFYGVLWAEGANDVIADKLQIPLYTITWIARVLVFAGPVFAYVITRRVCLGLQRKDREELRHGYESGIIRQLPGGEFIEVHEPVNEERRAVLEAKKVTALLPAPGSEDDNGVPAPSARGVLGKARAVANRAFTETIPVETDGHGNGHHGNGYHGNGRAVTGEGHEAVGEGHAAAGSGHQARLAPGDDSPGT